MGHKRRQFTRESKFAAIPLQSGEKPVNEVAHDPPYSVPGRDAETFRTPSP